MSPQKQKLLSAEVVLGSASGKSFNTHTAITSENIADYLPSPEVAEGARKAFAKAGFEVSEPTGVGMSITAPAGVFQKVFKVKTVPDGRGGVKVLAPGAGEGSYELPLNALPKELAKYVVAVTFSSPPDFGPGSY